MLKSCKVGAHPFILHKFHRIITRTNRCKCTTIAIFPNSVVLFGLKRSLHFRYPRTAAQNGYADPQNVAENLLALRRRDNVRIALDDDRNLPRARSPGAHLKSNYIWKNYNMRTQRDLHCIEFVSLEYDVVRLSMDTGAQRIGGGG
jgi:hypothetical protein